MDAAGTSSAASFLQTRAGTGLAGIPPCMYIHPELSAQYGPEPDRRSKIMDIDILLALQTFREGAGSVLSSFMEKMTFLGETNTVLVLIAVVYWCISRETGAYLLMGLSGNRLINGLVKVTACAYRPFIRDTRLVPGASASGYSFPSGHSTNAATMYGGILFDRKTLRWTRVLLGLLIALVAFSRLYLGVHTPQDVLTGAALGLVIMFGLQRLMQYLSEHPEKDVMIAGIGIVFAIAVALYAGFKSYPADYDAEGKLLVNGTKEANDTFKAVGTCLGFCIGWIMERRWVSFSTEIPGPQRLSRLTGGMLIFYLYTLVLMPLVNSWIPKPWGTILARFLQMFLIVFLYPYLMTRLEKRMHR